MEVANLDDLRSMKCEVENQDKKSTEVHGRNHLTVLTAIQLWQHNDNTEGEQFTKDV